MNLKTINDFVNNKKSQELFIEILVDGKIYYIKSILSDFENETLKIYTVEKSEY